MPHFIIHCSKDVFQQKPAAEIMQAVYDVAQASGLFAKGDMKVRIQPFEHCKLGEGKEDFLHVFGYIMQGRTIEQKAALSRAVITKLNDLLPALSVLSMNVSEFEKATYCNKAMLHPLNTTGDRHFSA